MLKLNEQELEKVKKEVANTLIKESVAAMADVGGRIHQYSIANCPIDSADLLNELTTNGLEPITDVANYRIGFKIGVSERVIPYIWMVEYGTRPMIEAHGLHDPRRPVTRWKAKDNRLDKGLLANPFSTLPFIRTAFIMNEDYAKERFAKLGLKIDFTHLTPEGEAEL